MTVLLILLVVFITFIVFMYNSLVLARQRVREGWSDIDVQLKRRYDLIPNLVETVKGYTKHESNTLQSVIKARNMAMSVHGNSTDRSNVENALSNTLKSIFALSEAYPDLKADSSFIQLQQEIADTEDKISASRRFYNSTVLSMNTRVEMFPSSLIAKVFHFEKEDFFESSEDEKEVIKKTPEISFK